MSSVNDKVFHESLNGLKTIHISFFNMKSINSSCEKCEKKTHGHVLKSSKKKIVIHHCNIQTKISYPKWEIPANCKQMTTNFTFCLIKIGDQNWI